MGAGVLTAPAASVLTDIATRWGTPTYVYDVGVIRDRHRALTEALADIPCRVHYSVKANSNLAILAELHRLGVGADIVSGGELRRVVAVGFPPERVVFSGVGKNAEELRAAVGASVGLINLESVEELDLLASMLDGRPVRVGIRVNPDVTTETHPYTQTGQGGMKFGVPLDQVPALAARVAAVDGVALVSVGMHIGSQIVDSEPYRHGASVLAGLIADLPPDQRRHLESVDIGGGLGISYTGEPALDPAAFADVVRQLHRDTGLTVLLEPGRFLVGHAGTLLTRVLYCKHSGGRDFLIVDAGMNDLLRPALYQARHPVRVIDPGPEPRPPRRVDVVGPICETGDFLARDWPVEAVGPGGLVTLEGVGAYGFSMSSGYNSRPRAAEVLVDGARIGLARCRETIDHLLTGETPEPEWIA